MKTYKQFIKHLWNQDDGAELVGKFEQHVKKLDEELTNTGQVSAAGMLFADRDWIDEFLSESEMSTVVYRYLAKLAKEQSGLLPAITVGQVLDDFRDYWLCELAAADAQYDHEAE